MGKTDRHGVSAGKTKTNLFLCNKTPTSVTMNLPSVTMQLSSVTMNPPFVTMQLSSVTMSPPFVTVVL